MLLLRGVSLRTALIMAAIVAVIYVALGVRGAQLDGLWRIDEGERIAEGYFWRLLRRGDLTNPDWFRQITVRSHPQVSKYFFGAAVSAAGVAPPRNLGLVQQYDAGAAANSMPAVFAAEYLPMRRPARLASFLLNVLTAAGIFAVILRLEGFAAAAISQLLLFRHYLFSEALFYARSDTVETFFTTATLIAMLACRRHVAFAAVAGLLAAFAFQTRLNGGVAIAMCMVFLLVRAPRDRRTFIAVALAVVTFAVVSIAINPYYWAEPRAGAPAMFLVHEPLPLRIVHRFAQQVRDLDTLLLSVPPEWHLPSLPARMAFAARSLFSGKSGIAIAVGLLLSLGTIRLATAQERAAIGWALTGAIVVAFWLPLRWDIYLLMVVPACVAAAAIGYGVALRSLAMRFSGGIRDSSA